MNYEIGDFVIKPYQGETCWELFEWRDVKERVCKGGSPTGKANRKLVSTGYYPTNLGHALQIILDHSMMKGSGKRDLKQAMDSMRAMFSDLGKIGNPKGDTVHDEIFDEGVIK